MSKLSDVVKNNVVKKTVYDKIAAKVNSIDTNDFVLKAKYQTDKKELEKKFLIWLTDYKPVSNPADVAKSIPILHKDLVGKYNIR